jgi:PKD repeat protein
VCTNNELTFVNTTPDLYAGELLYEWSVAGVVTETTRDLAYSFPTTGDYTIKLKTSIPGCSGEQTQTITGVGEGPLVDFVIDGRCVGESVSFTNASSGSIVGYEWALGEGDASTATSVTKVFAGAGLYTVTLQATGTNGCESSVSESHTIYSNPQPDFNTDLPPFSCSGTATQFNDLTPLLTDSNLDTWLWQFDDGGSAASIQSPQHTYAQSGTYNVSLTVTSDQGCASTAQKQIVIAPSPLPVISTTAACVDASTTLADASGDTAAQWQWQVGNNFYFTESPEHVFAEPGTYTIQLNLTAENGCMGSASKQVSVLEPLVPDFTIAKNCVGEEAVLTATVPLATDVPQTYQWSINTETVNGQVINYSFASTGLQEVALQVTGQSGCDYSITRAVTIVEAPVANFTTSTSFGPPPLAVQFTNVSTYAASYRWQFNDALNSSSQATSPSFTYTTVGSYAIDLTAFNAQGCEHTVSKLIEVAFPVISVALTELRVVEDNGTQRLLITLQNNGNVALISAPVELSLANGVALREMVTALLVGGQSNVYSLNTSLSPTSAGDWICVSLLLDDNVTQAIEQCVTINDNTVLIEPSPNPAGDFVTLQWISGDTGTAEIELLTGLGETITRIQQPSTEGLNSIRIDVQSLQPGLYFFRIQSGKAARTFRTIIAR